MGADAFPKHLLRVEFFLSPPGLTAGQNRALDSIPGVWPRNASYVSAPRNASAIVERALNHWGVPVARTVTKKVDTCPVMTGANFKAQWNPGTLKLFRKYQNEAIRQGFRREAYGIEGMTGCGKTWVAIKAALCRLGPLIWVTKSGPAPQHCREFMRLQRHQVFHWKPASHRRKKDRWQGLDEYLEWCRSEAPELAGGGPGWRQRPIVVLGWANLARNIRELEELCALSPTTAVFDEIQEAKGKKRKKRIERQYLDRWNRQQTDVTYEHTDSQTGAAARLGIAARRRIGASATWVPNRFTDWWGELDVIDPMGWGGKMDFSVRYGLGFQGDYGFVWDHPEIPAEARPWTAEFNSRKDTIVYRIPDEEVRKELPPREISCVPVSSEVQGKPLAVKAMMKQAAKIGRMALREAMLVEASARLIPWTLEQLPDWVQTNEVRKGKVLLFYLRQRDVELMAKRATTKLKGTKARAAVDVDWYHGGRTDKRAHDVQGWFMNHPGPCVAVLSIQACGTGMDWHDADYQVNCGIPYDPVTALQLAGRSWRLGLDRMVRLLWPYAEGTIAEHHLAILMSKWSDVNSTTMDTVALDLQQAMAGDPEEIINDYLDSWLSGKK